MQFKWRDMHMTQDTSNLSTSIDRLLAARTQLYDLIDFQTNLIELQSGVINQINENISVHFRYINECHTRQFNMLNDKLDQLHDQLIKNRTVNNELTIGSKEFNDTDSISLDIDSFDFKSKEINNSST